MTESQEEHDREVARREREQMAAEIQAAAFEVFTDTDGYKSIRVHSQHEGMMVAREIVLKGLYADEGAS